MKRLLVVIVVLAALWSGYWMVARGGVQRGLTGWFQAQRDAGWQAEYADLSVTGYPNRVDAYFTELALADPRSGWAWNAPEFALLSLSYQPNHVIAVWPDTQLIATPLGKYRVTSADMRASARVSGLSLALDKVLLSAETLALSHEVEGQTAAAITAEGLNAGIERQEGSNTYRIGLNAAGVAPALEFRRLIDPKGSLPRTLDALSVDMTIGFDRPWDRAALEQARPQYRRIDLKLAEATWGELSLAAAGALDVDAEGRATGRITIKARNWREIIGAARASGAIPGAVAGRIEQALGLVSRMSGNPKTLDIPLDFKGGLVLLGPVPVAQLRLQQLR